MPLIKIRVQSTLGIRCIEFADLIKPLSKLIVILMQLPAAIQEEWLAHDDAPYHPKQMLLEHKLFNNFFQDWRFFLDELICVLNLVALTLMGQVGCDYVLDRTEVVIKFKEVVEIDGVSKFTWSAVVYS